MKSTRWLIVATSGDMRVVKNEPDQISAGEYAFEVVVNIPERTKKRRNAIVLDLPDLSPQIDEVKVGLYTDEPEPEETEEAGN